MTQWYVKDLSKLTSVSVQTLHHYDRIGLMKPSIRLTNGYRLYSERDLLKLQQIIALKFFGFQLSQIKTLLSGGVETLEHFSAQVNFLEQKAKTLLDASKALKSIISEVDANKLIPWETIIKSIEVYNMTKDIENTWVANALTHDELKQYAKFESELKTRFTEEEAKDRKQKWSDLVGQVSSNLDRNPKSDFGAKIAKEIMDWVGALYGKEHTNISHSLWHNGFKAGKTDIDPKVISWMDKATDHYYRGRISNILDISSTDPNGAEISWNSLIEEMCGDVQHLKDDIINAVMKDDKTSDAAKKWLQRISCI